MLMTTLCDKISNLEVRVTPPSVNALMAGGEIKATRAIS
jgi:hypothetical protein